jgi:chromosome segregation ATPase
MPRALFTGAGGFDETLEFSEDWDFLIRLSFETSFRHVRAVTCEYRVFEVQDGDPLHVSAGGPAFQKARREIYRRYANRRTEEGLARVLDRLRAQIAFASDRDGISQGELRYHRDAHRRLGGQLDRLEAEIEEAAAGTRRAEELEKQWRREAANLELERGRLLAENEMVHERVTGLFASNEEYARRMAGAHAEIQRLEGLLSQIYRSRTWKLHLFLEKVRGR